MYLLIDNYDSFTFILRHYLLATGNECVVYRNDAITVESIERLHPDRIIISPGPETPLQAGISMEVIARFHSRLPILGVCLGHQALGMFFGAKLVHVAPRHGKTSTAFHDGHPLFSGVPTAYTVMRYHSLALADMDKTRLQSISVADDGVNMGIVHPEYPCVGLQYHPESVLTEHGLQIIRNWAAIKF